MSAYYEITLNYVARVKAENAIHAMQQAVETVTENANKPHAVSLEVAAYISEAKMGIEPSEVLARYMPVNPAEPVIYMPRIEEYVPENSDRKGYAVRGINGNYWDSDTRKWRGNKCGYRSKVEAEKAIKIMTDEDMKGGAL